MFGHTGSRREAGVADALHSPPATLLASAAPCLTGCPWPLLNAAGFLPRRKEQPMQRKRWILGIPVLVGVLGLSAAAAQPPTPLWTHTYGGASPEKGYAVKELPDGGFIFS